MTVYLLPLFVTVSHDDPVDAEVEPVTGLAVMVFEPPTGAKEVELVVTVMLFALCLTDTYLFVPLALTVIVPVREDALVLA